MTKVNIKAYKERGQTRHAVFFLKKELACWSPTGALLTCSVGESSLLEKIYVKPGG